MGCGNSNGNCLTRRADVDGNSRRRPTGQRFVSYNLYGTERIGQLIIECGHNESRFESEQTGDQFDNPAAGSDVSKKLLGAVTGTLPSSATIALASMRSISIVLTPWALTWPMSLGVSRA